MLHCIKGLFQKGLDSKTGKTGDHKADVRGRITAEMPQNSKQQHLRQNQHGRSMIEMLGVLVIIGVLSIGAVAGYRYAMNKYRANETINEVALRAVDVAQAASNNKIEELTMQMGNKTKLGYDVDAWVNENDTNFFYISVDNVPAGVCRQILKMEWKTPTDIYVGTYFYAGDDIICGKSDIAPRMDFEFYKDFALGADNNMKQPVSEWYGITDGFYETTAYDENGVCSDPNKPLFDVYGDQCVSCDAKGAVYVGARGQCEEVCPKRLRTSNNYCYFVPTCSDSTPLASTNGSCYACTYSGSIWVGETGKCEEVCPSRHKMGEYCLLSTCSGSKPLQNQWGSCYACTYSGNVDVGTDGKCEEVCPTRHKVGERCLPNCPANTPLQHKQGSCYACTYSGNVNVGADGKCEEVCPTRHKVGERCLPKCPTDKPLQDQWGTCYSCKTAQGVAVGDQECESICPNREINQEFCVPKCTDDTPLKDTSGNCHPCDADGAVYVGERGKCEVACPNRHITTAGFCTLPCSSDNPLQNQDRGSCYACTYSGNVNVGADGKCEEVCPTRHKVGSTCALGTCSGSKPLGVGSNCYACNYSGRVWVSAEGKCEEVCPSRHKVGEYCLLSSCSGSTPLQAGWGGCYACDTPDSVYVGENGPCEEICPDRHHEFDYCVLKTCPSSAPLKDQYGTCHACDTSANIFVGRNGPCEEICPSRYKKGLSCYRKCPADTPIQDSFGSCYACDYPNTFWNEIIAGLAECANQRFTGTAGQSYPCSYTGRVHASAAECAWCSERVSELSPTGKTVCVLKQ